MEKMKCNEPERQKLVLEALAVSTAFLLRASKEGTFDSPGLTPEGEGRNVLISAFAVPRRENSFSSTDPIAGAQHLDRRQCFYKQALTAHYYSRKGLHNEGAM